MLSCVRDAGILRQVGRDTAVFTKAVPAAEW